MLTVEKARQKWRYDPETGNFFYLSAPRYDIAAGSRAGGFNGKYWMLSFEGRYYKAARVAWLMMTESWPDEQVDHINGDKLDDRFCNLREATNAENCRNRKARSNNTLGIKGVSKAPGKRKGYTSVIAVNGKQKYLGYFPTPEAAKAAYDSAAKVLHGEFARS